MTQIFHKRILSLEIIISLEVIISVISRTTQLIFALEAIVSVGGEISLSKVFSLLGGLGLSYGAGATVSRPRSRGCTRSRCSSRPASS